MNLNLTVVTNLTKYDTQNTSQQINMQGSQTRSNENLIICQGNKKILSVLNSRRERIVKDEKSKFTLFCYSLWIGFRFVVNCNTPVSFVLLSLLLLASRDNTDAL